MTEFPSIEGKGRAHPGRRGLRAAGRGSGRGALSALSAAALAAVLGTVVGVWLDGGATERAPGEGAWLRLAPPVLYEEPAMPPSAPIPDFSPPERLAAPDSPAPEPPAAAPAPGVTGPASPAGAPAPAWLRHAVAVPASLGRPMIAIVIDDLGMDRKRSARAVRLPGPLTMSFLPYAEDLDRQTSAARVRGHELMVHVPMEPQHDFVDPGPQALLTTLDELELKRRLRWDLARFDGYVGVNNHMGSRFTGDRGAMLVVLREIKSRGLLYLDSRTTAATVAARLAAEIGLPHASRDVFIDHVPSDPAIRAKLETVEGLARRRGYAVGIGHPYDTTLDALEAWLPTVQRRGFLLVPVSAVVRQRTHVVSRDAGDRAGAPSSPHGG